ncbi:MAG: hypothetical protein CME58_04055 [Halieaceae bacterium]|nr:hypothetical protein [Halieaceae bacterium]
MVSIAVIGPGLVGREHIKRILDHSRAELAAVVSPSHGDGESEFPTGDKTQIFNSVEELVDSGMAFDGIMICSPTQNHFEHLMALRNIANYIFVEKPIFSSLEDIKISRSELTEEERRRILVGHHRRHSSYFGSLHDTIKLGKLGEIRCYSGHVCFYKPDKYFSDAPWRMEPGGGPIFINLIHEVDLMQRLFGPIASVEAMTSGGEPTGSSLENTCVANLQHKNGIIGSFVISDRTTSTMSWERSTGENPAFPNDGGDYLYIFGAEGSISFPDFKLVYSERPDWTKAVQTEFLVPRSRVICDPLQAQIEHFISICEGTTAHSLVTFEEGIANQQVCEALKTAAAEARRISVPDV